MVGGCNQTNPWRPLGMVLDLGVLPTICLLGLLLNLACLVVFTKRRKHPLVPSLMLLSICDSLQLLFSLLVLYLPALHDYLEMDPIGWVAQIAYLATGGLAGGLLAANCASIWTMCYIAIQRHRAIVKPLSTVTASKSGPQYTLWAIGLAALLFNVPVWFEFSWSITYFNRDANDVVEEPNKDAASIIWHSKSSLSLSPSYKFIMQKVLYPLVVYFLPLVLISVLNMRMLSQIAAAAAATSQHHSISLGQHSSKRNHSERGHFKHRMAKERRSLMLLTSIVVLFFVCHTGGLIIRLLDLSEYSNAPCFVFAKDFVNFMFNINSFADPMMYFFFTKQFRDLRTNWNFKNKSFIKNGHEIQRNNSTLTTRRLLLRLSTQTVG